MESLVDYRKNEKSMSVADQKSVICGQPVMIKSTAGWQIRVQCRYGLTSWKLHKYLKESHPFQTSEYDLAQGIDHETGFNWWIDSVLIKMERIISLVKKRNSRYLKKTHKFGIELPKSVTEAY